MPKPRAPLSWGTGQDGEPLAWRVDLTVLDDLIFRRGINRSQLAKAADTSRGYITDICEGRRQPGWPVLSRIATALDVPARALICHVVTASSDAPARDGSAA